MTGKKSDPVFDSESPPVENGILPCAQLCSGEQKQAQQVIDCSARAGNPNFNSKTSLRRKSGLRPCDSPSCQFELPNDHCRTPYHFLQLTTGSACCQALSGQIRMMDLRRIALFSEKGPVAKCRTFKDYTGSWQGKCEGGGLGAPFTFHHPPAGDGFCRNR